MDKNGGPNHLQAWRLYRGLTQERLAEKVGTSLAQISLLESGDRGLTARWLRRLAPALDTAPGTLLDHPPTEPTAQIYDIWDRASLEERRQIVGVAEALIRYKAG